MVLSYTIYLKYFVPVSYGMAPKNKVQITLIVSCEASSFLDICNQANGWVNSEVVMRIAVAELLAFA